MKVMELPCCSVVGRNSSALLRHGPETSAPDSGEYPSNQRWSGCVHAAADREGRVPLPEADAVGRPVPTKPRIEERRSDVDKMVCKNGGWAGYALLLPAVEPGLGFGQ
jgi:hypothetical protein